MTVLVVHVGNVRMPMPHPRMPVRMHMRLAGRIIRQMLVLVMLVVHVSMCMLHWLMLVLMFVMLGEVQPDAAPHQEAGS